VESVFVDRSESRFFGFIRKRGSFAYSYGYNGIIFWMFEAWEKESRTRSGSTQYHQLG
jgi:hypothetical protein